MAQKPLSEASAREAMEAYAKFGVAIKAASALGLPKSTFESRLKAARRMFAGGEKLPEPEKKPEPTVDERSALQKLRDENSRLRTELQGAYRGRVEEDEILAMIGILAKADVSPPDWPTAQVRRTKGNG